MKTIEVSLQPADALRILRTLDEDDNLSLLIGESVGGTPIVLEPWADGNPTRHKFALYPNGTWAATTEVYP